MTQEEVIYINNILDEIKKPITSLTVLSSCIAIRGESEGNYAFINTRDTLENCYFEEGSMLQTIQPYSFYRCYKLKEIDLSVCTYLTTIRESAFWNCKSLSSIKFPSSLQEIGANAFEYTGLTDVVIPSSVTCIRAYAFASATKLESFTFEEDSRLNTLWDHIFVSTKIKSFYIPTHIKSITGNCFESCMNLVDFQINTSNPYLQIVNGILYKSDMQALLVCPPGKSGSLAIPDDVKAIETTAFISSRLTDITFSSKLEQINSWAFFDSLITELVLPISIRIIEFDAFRYCINLQSIILPEGLEQIGTRAFAYCSNLKSIQFPSTLKTLEGGAFLGISNINISFDPSSNLKYENQLNWIINKNETYITQCLGSENNYTIGSTYETIGDSAFKDKTSLEKIFFDQNSQLTTIEANAFAGCQSLYVIEIPSTVISIGKQAFYNCVSLPQIDLTLNVGLTLIDEEAFLDCHQLKTINLPIMNAEARSQTSLTLNDKAFMNCYNLINASLGDNLVALGEYCFMNCYSLQYILIPDLCTSFDGYVFQHCTALESCEISSSNQITIISEYMFYNCSKLSIFTFPQGITQIGSYAFVNTALTDIIIPESVITIQRYAFQDCAKLQTFTISNESQLITLESGVFSGCRNFSEIFNYGQHFVLWNSALFDFNQTELIILPPACNIKYFYFPDSVKKIRSSACEAIHSLEVVVLPGTITTIESDAFKSCKNLRFINIPRNATVGQNCFENCNKLQCGLAIENESQEYRDNLISYSKLPRRCLSSCENTFARCSYSFEQFYLSMFAIMIIASK